MRRKGLLAAVTVFLACLLPASCAQGPSVASGDPVDRVASEAVVVRIDPAAPPIGSGYHVSPDARRVAYLVEAGDGWAAVIDGQQGKAYEWSVLFEQKVASSFAWSDDGSRVAYVGRADGKEFAVIDGEEGKPYDEVSLPVFSQDGRRVAYVAAEGSRLVAVPHGWDHANYVPNPDRKRFAVLDGQEGPAYRGDGDAFAFSPDLSRLAYAATDEGWHGLALDGKESEYHVLVSDSPFSESGRDVVVDRREGGGYGYVKRLFFSPDGLRLAYIASDYALAGAPFIIAVDGQEYGPYSGYCCPAFSPDGRHLTWTASRGWDEGLQIVDGRELGPHAPGVSFLFSPDSRRFAYAASEGEERFVVVDERPGKRYEEIVSQTLTFGPDSRRLAYAAGADGRQFVVLDGREGQPYESILYGSLTFSADSRHLAYVVEEDGRQFVVVGESEGERYDEVLRRLVVFDSATSFHYLARRGDEILLVEERIE